MFVSASKPICIVVLNMADVSKSVVIRSLCDAVPMSFLCGVDGTATISSSRLASRFQL